VAETLPIRHRLVGISAKAYEHPADRAATAALKSIPVLDTAVRKLIELRYERALRQVFLASSVKLGPDQLPDVWAIYENAVATLDLPKVYDLYLTQYPLANAAAIGSERPLLLLSSQTVELLEPDELGAVLGHELGHVLSDHVLYQTALQILLRLTFLRIPIVAGLPLVALRSALLEWARAAELSCDRAATLVTRDPLVMCRTLMVLAGGATSRRLSLDAFLRQATEYHEWESGVDRARRFFVEFGQTHDFPVRRVAELMKWVRSGEYDRIIGGSYPRRDDPVDAREHAEEAYVHYRERFTSILRDAGEGVASASERLVERFDEWLGKKEEPPGPEP
jgi:Zn-dependent protease with chaperone function